MRKLLYSSLFAVAFAFANPLFATHIVGGELGYKYLGNDTFLITLDLYRDYCGENAAALDLYSFIDIFRDNGQQWPGIPKEAKSLKFISKDTVPNNIAGDPCLFVPNDVCIEHSRWEGKVRIVGSGGFYIVYQRCCRNANIVNILAPDDVGTTYWLYVSPLARSLNNNSPEFGFYPPVYVCVNYPIAHPHAGTDVDGDDLVYKLYTPYLGAYPDSSQPQPFPAPAGVGNILPPPFDTVVWNSPNFSLSQVLGPSPDPLRFDPVTGLITGFPQIQGRFVIGLLVEEYRNGQLLSVVRRDFQYDVGQCAELDVQIEAPDAQCDDLTVHFENFTDVAQNFIWYFDWPNPTPFSTQKEPTFTFPDTGTYVVALVAEPVGACVDTAFHTIYLQNNSLTPDFSWQTYDCTSQSVLVLTDLSTDPVSPVDTWAWTVVYGSTTLTSNLQNPVFQIPNTASGTITLTASSVNGCEQTKTVSFAAGGNNPTDDIDPIAPFCLGSPVSLNPTGAVPGFTYQWSAPVPPAQQTLANPTVMLTQNTTFTVTITGFGGLCQSTVQVLAQVFQPVQLAFSPDTDCDATIVHFVNQSQNAPSGFVWNFGDPSTNADVSMEANPTWDYPAFGSYTVTLMTAPNAVCKDTIQQSILLEQKTLEAAFSFGYTGCEEGGVSVQFFDETENSEDDTNGWLWTFSGAYTGTSTQMNPSVMVSQEGWLYVTFQATTSEGCTDATALDSLWIDLTELPNLDPGGTTVQACLNGGATLNPGGDTTYIYAWSPSTGLSCANCPSPLANPSQSTVYTVLIQNPNGADTCAITRQVNVTVPTNVNLVSSADVESCNDSTTIFTSVGLLPVTFAWFNDSGAQVAGNVPTLTVPISGYAYYVVRATDPLGCHYYDTTNVVGGPVNIEAVGDQIKCSDEPLTIFATNLDQNDTLAWQWAADPIFNGPTNLPNPTVSNLPGDRWLYVTATNQFGCSATDSVYVAVVDTSNMLGFEFVAACNGSTVQFVNTSTNAFNFSWNFGDPTATDDISFADNPVYNYPGPGTYPVRLTMDFDLACVDTLQQNVVIESTQFIPDFTFEYVACETDSVDVQFHDATTILQVG
ncbi:MAG: hypothetical protein MUC59_01875, partial [Saprospiraceae bacterium]|nr:hypothetical protein [Saprospiraceae bacterium]